MPTAPDREVRPGRGLGPTAGVVLAGGVGTRLGLSIPKQLVRLRGHTILEWSVAALHSCPEIDEVIVMMAPDHVDVARRELGQRYPKLRGVFPGGDTRNESTRLMLDQLTGPDRKVLLHDAVRPLLDPRIVTECVLALDHYSAVDVAIPTADTIIAVDDDDRIVGIPERHTLRRGQTPQAFLLSVLERAYRRAAADPAFHATDDCGVVHRYLPEVPITVVAGAEHNIKVTHPPDLVVAEALLADAHVGQRGGRRSLAGARVEVSAGASLRGSLAAAIEASGATPCREGDGGDAGVVELGVGEATDVIGSLVTRLEALGLGLDSRGTARGIVLVTTDEAGSQTRALMTRAALRAATRAWIESREGTSPETRVTVVSGDRRDRVDPTWSGGDSLVAAVVADLMEMMPFEPVSRGRIDRAGES